MGQVASETELILHKAAWKRSGQRVVFAQGTFDLLHPGHVRMLEQARALGDVLVVGVRSDAAIRRLESSTGDTPSKSLPRPITPAAERAEILAALASIDFVVEFDAATPQQLVALLQPDIIVEGGGDGKAGQNRKAREPGQPEIVFIPLEPGISTSDLIERIQQLRA